MVVFYNRYYLGALLKKRDLTIKLYNSFQEEAADEYKRRSQQTPEERMKEFSILQERCWGEKWTHSKIEHLVTFEEMAW